MRGVNRGSVGQDAAIVAAGRGRFLAEPFASSTPMVAATPGARSARTRRTPMGILIVVFGVLAAVTAIQAVLARRAAGEPGDVWPTVGYSAAVWLAWLVLVPIIVRLGRRHDFAPRRRLSSAAVHLVGALVAHTLTTAVAVWVGVTLYNPQEAITWEMLRQATLLSSRLPLSVLTYAGVLAADRALTLYQALTEREVLSARLEAQATRARLETLAARLQPHFLFNALQSVGALVDEDPARARTMLAQIGDLLRDVLAAPGETEVALEDEVALLARYLAIEEVRFADRLVVEYDIDPASHAVRVPRFLLQPLAENALRHGLAPQPGRGTLRVTSRREPDAVELTIWNDGVPLPGAMREGVGLATTRERLAARYDGQATFRLVPQGGGVAATVRLPA